MKTRYSKLLVSFFLLLLLFAFFSCVSINNSKKESKEINDPVLIFKNSLITSNDSQYYLYKNKSNIFIFEKKIDMDFMYYFLKEYNKNINRYLNINKITRKNIEDDAIKILMYVSIDLPFNNQDSILKYIFDKNSMRLNDINIYFRLQKWGGLFDKPDLIVMNLNKSKYEDLSKENKLMVLFHEYLHYLFYIRFNDYLVQKIFENPENEILSYHYSFLTEMLSYFNGEAFLYFLKNEDSLKLTEEKVTMFLRNWTEKVTLPRSSKDPITVVKNYDSNNAGAILYFFNFANFLIKYKGFDNFIGFLQYVFNGEKKDLDEIFKIFYDCDFRQIFELWKIN